MEKLEDGKRYDHLVINGVRFEIVRVFILNGKIDIVDCSTGATVASVFEKNIKTLN